MKKMFLFAAMASVAFASCTTDESVFDAAKEQGKIEFVAANYAAQTRGEHDDKTFTNDDYNVWAWEDSTNTNLFMNKAVVTYDGTTSSIDKTYYWPNYALDFVATTPAGDPRISVARDDKGVSTITFTINSTKGNDHVTNLMYADFVEQYYNQAVTPAVGNPTVALKFRHVLSRLNVIVNQVNPTLPTGITGYNVTVNSLSFDDFLNEGSLEVKEGVYNGATTNYLWTPGTATDDWSIIPSDTDIETTSFATNYVHGDKNYFVMPQTIPADAKLNIAYTVTTRFENGTSSVQPFTTSIELNKIMNGTTPITEWRTNKNITYTINITPAALKPISFTVNEEEMGEIGGTQQF